MIFKTTKKCCYTEQSTKMVVNWRRYWLVGEGPSERWVMDEWVGMTRNWCQHAMGISIARADTSFARLQRGYYYYYFLSSFKAFLIKLLYRIVLHVMKVTNLHDWPLNSSKEIYFPNNMCVCVGLPRKASFKGI